MFCIPAFFVFGTEKILFQKTSNGRWWGRRRYAKFDVFVKFATFIKFDIFIKFDKFIKFDNFVKIWFLTISSTVFDILINCWQQYQLLIFSSTIWLKYQLSVPANCNFAENRRGVESDHIASAQRLEGRSYCPYCYSYF